MLRHVLHDGETHHRGAISAAHEGHTEVRVTHLTGARPIAARGPVRFPPACRKLREISSRGRLPDGIEECGERPPLDLFL